MQMQNELANPYFYLFRLKALIKQYSTNSAIAASGSNVYVVWFDSTPGNSEILLRKSVNAGDVFGSTVNYSHSTGDSIAPTIAVSPNNY